MILKSTPLPSLPPAPPGNIPAGYRGEAWLPSGRPIFWTGRVAIGIRHAASERERSLSADELLVQSAVLEGRPC